MKASFKLFLFALFSFPILSEASSPSCANSVSSKSTVKAFNRSDRYYDSDIFWDMKVGATWKAVLEPLGIPQDGVVIEVAPGDRTKIAQGLSSLRFSGTLYVVEPSKPALDRLIERYKSILPSVRVIGINKILDEAIPILPRNADAILSNHPLDDMIVANSINKNQKSAIFNNVETSESHQEVTRAWGNLMSDSKLLEASIAKTVSSWEMAVQALSPRLLVISQYESGYFRLQHLTAPDQAAKTALNLLQKKFGKTNSNIISRINRFRMQGDRWLVSSLRPGSRNLPDAVHRWGSGMFLKINANLIPQHEQSLIFKSTGFATPMSDYALRIDSFQVGGGVQVYVDRQVDPLNIAMNGNLGSGRAAYTVDNLNLKGLGKTPFAVSRDKDHSNGGLDMRNAIWELIASNMVHTNFRKGASPTLALLDRGDFLKVYWSHEPLKAAILVRKDESGTLDRPTHLFATGRSLDRHQILDVAKNFGEQDAEKFIERIVHGAWSAGNISLSGHMIDFDQVASLVGRAPVYTLTGKWLGNQFGLEDFGQLKILQAMASDLRINKDRVSFDQLKEEFYQTRKEMMIIRFSDLMGIPAAQGEYFSNPNYAKLKNLVNQFEKVSRYMKPDLDALAGWKKSSESVSVFDVSRFMRMYPILKLVHGKVNGMSLMFNPISLEFKNSEYLSQNVKDYLKENDFIVDSTTALENAMSEARQFVALYEELMVPLLNRENPYISPEELAAQAYRVNENRTYLLYSEGYRLAGELSRLYSKNKISRQRLNRILMLLQISIDRLPLLPDSDQNLTDVQIYRDGWTARKVNLDGSHQVIIGLFTDQINLTVPNTISFGGTTLKKIKSEIGGEVVFQSGTLPKEKLIEPLNRNQIQIGESSVILSPF
jgi:hypothetical protein